MGGKMKVKRFIMFGMTRRKEVSRLRNFRGALLLMLFLGLAASDAVPKKFYDDDPIEKEPPPIRVEDAESRKLNDYYDFISHTFATPGEKQPKKGKKGKPIRALDVNTLDEAPDSAWFTNRIGSRPMSIEEVLRGPGNENAPAEEGKWTIVGAKSEGISPGFRIRDSKGRMYLLKFDPLGLAEMATGADAIGSIFFHALGYHVPENYLVTLERDKLVIGKDVTFRDVKGRRRSISSRVVGELLLRVPRDAQGRIRGIASYFLKGKILGGFRYNGTRADDPNDVVLHEHRRDLRGLFVFCAWLGHNDSRAVNTLDCLVEENGLKYIKHHLIDFGSTLGSAADGRPTARDGHAYLYGFRSAAAQIFSLGLYVPPWARHRYRKFPSLGIIDYRNFDPEKWKPNYPNPAFRNRLPDDTFWAAKKVMAFTNSQIRAIVKLGKYSNPDAEAWLGLCLIERRDRVGKRYFARVLPFDRFLVRDGRLEFDDLEVQYGFRSPREYNIQWSRFDNESETHTVIEGATTRQLPSEMDSSPPQSYFAAVLQDEDPAKTATVYMRKQANGWKVVGLDRTW